MSQVTDYQRQLNISKALATTSYVYKGTKFEREAFASFPDNLLVQRFTKEGAETLDFTIELSLSRDLASDGKYEEEKSDYKECKLDITDSYILMKGELRTMTCSLLAVYLGKQMGILEFGQIRLRYQEPVMPIFSWLLRLILPKILLVIIARK